MTSPAASEIMAMLRADRAANSQTPLALAVRRSRFEERARLVPIPATLSVIPRDFGGVRCDVLTPPGASEAPTMLYLHGGAYCLGSPRSHRELIGRIAHAAGMKAVAPDYRLAPEHPFPAALDDAMSVYGAILESTGAPPTALAGDSAGGGLALALLVALRDRKLPAPRAAAVISPWTDLTLSGASMIQRASLDPYLSPDSLEKSAAAYAGDTSRRDPLISPLFANLAGLPPLLVEVGSLEILFDDAARFVDRARAAGCDARLVVGDQLFHVYHGFPTLPEARDGTDRVGRFLARFR